MKKIITLSVATLCAFAGAANAASVLVNFGSVADSSSTGVVYNNITGDTAASGNARRQAVSTRDFIANAVYSDGSGASGIGVSINGTGTIANLNNAWGLNSVFTPAGANAGVVNAWNSATGASDTTIGDFGLGGLSGVTVHLSGLTLGQEYSVFLLCGNNADGNSGVHNLTFTGVDIAQAYDFSGVTMGAGSFSGMTSTATAPSTVKLSGSNYVGNGLQAFTTINFFASGNTLDILYDTASTKIGINAVGIQAIPEPSTYALLGGIAAAGVTLAVRRRKRA